MGRSRFYFLAALHATVLIAAASLERPAAPGSLRVFSTVQDPSAPEEFYGPFSGWLDVQRDFGAAGDGVTDDTSALQRAFDAVQPLNAPAVVYLPRGNYRITGTLEIRRSGHSDSKDIMILGDHPATTLIRWDGPADGVMLKFGAWWTRLGRITFDGASRAGTAIRHGDMFSSINELSDLVIRDVALGIEAGTMNGTAVAETAVLRCHFLRCARVAISMQNWNSLDWFVWDSHFDDCRLGVANVFGAGNFHVYRSVFRRSTEADISIGNTGYFSVRHCTSFRSKAFFSTGASGAPALLTIQGNTILEPQGTPVLIGNLGPLLFCDNIVANSNQPAVRFQKLQAGVVSIGNTFATGDAIHGTTNVVAFDNDFSLSNQSSNTFSLAPSVPPRATGPVIELQPGATTVEIQEAITVAASISKLKPIIHLPAGVYFIDKTLTIPPASDLRLIGDGGKTVLHWASPNTGVVLRVQGPAHAVLRDLRIYGASAATGLVVEGADQTGGQIFLDQVDVRHQAQTGIRVNGMSRTVIQLHSFYHSLSRFGVQVIGTGWGAGSDASNAVVAILGGASADNELSYDVCNGGQLLVQDTWYETAGVRYPEFMRCTNAGNFTLQGAKIAPMRSTLQQPTLLVDRFRGRLSVLATQFVFPGTHLSVSQDGPDAKVLLLGNLNSVTPVIDSTNAAVAQVQNLLSTPDGGASNLPDKGSGTPDFLREMLTLTRQQRPLPVTPIASNLSSIRLHRVFVEFGQTGIQITP